MGWVPEEACSGGVGGVLTFGEGFSVTKGSLRSFWILGVFCVLVWVMETWKNTVYTFTVITRTWEQWTLSTYRLLKNVHFHESRVLNRREKTLWVLKGPSPQLYLQYGWFPRVCSHLCSPTVWKHGNAIKSSELRQLGGSSGYQCSCFWFQNKHSTA